MSIFPYPFEVNNWGILEKPISRQQFYEYDFINIDEPGVLECVLNQMENEARSESREGNND